MGYARLGVVTGASSVIGLELARLFAADGYDLVVVADEAEINDAASELADAEVHVEPVRVDLRSDDAVEHVYDVVSAGGARLSEAFALASSLTSKVAAAVRSVLPDSLKAAANRLIVARFDDR